MNKPFALIIEDNPQLSDIFAIALKPHFDTEVAGDGTTAFMRLAEVNPDIIVLDLNLPGMSGGELLLHIRQDSRLKHAPVILCTADHHTAEALQDKADIILLKPVNPIQLQQIAARLIAR
jgi:CheY-like chemotaxis protein